MSTMIVRFPGGKRVDAEYGGFTIGTDQPPRAGGEGSGPQPFDLFLASIATCAGIYAKSFCDQRGLSAPLGLEMDITRRDDGYLSRLDLVLHVDAGFPAKYDSAIIRAMELCAVKKQLREDIVTSIRVERAGHPDAAS